MSSPAAVDVTEALLAAALLARDHAYAPYSGYAVGAAVRDARGRSFVGVNVENPSYGLTVCAERNAVGAAAAAGVRPGELVEVAVAAQGSAGSVTPCGACRQVLAHWCAPAAQLVACALPAGTRLTQPVAALLPGAFALAPTR